jgi:hypothetical protein
MSMRDDDSAGEQPLAQVEISAHCVDDQKFKLPKGLPFAGIRHPAVRLQFVGDKRWPTE